MYHFYYIVSRAERLLAKKKRCLLLCDPLRKSLGSLQYFALVGVPANEQMVIKKLTAMDKCSLYFAPGIKSPFRTSLIFVEPYFPLKGDTVSAYFASESLCID
jgi:hypothetical protein